MTETLPDPQVVALEQLASAAKLNMAEVLREADVAQSTWFRWRIGKVEPKVRTLRRVEAAIRQRVTPLDAA